MAEKEYDPPPSPTLSFNLQDTNLDDSDLSAGVWASQGERSPGVQAADL